MTAKKTKKGKSLHEKMRQLYETLRDYKDTKGRQLSLIFLRLPNMKEFPDYYEVIKRPIDFEKIGAKLKQGLYQNLESCFDDFALMFDNACKFNEPDSQIYKDALTLNGLAKQ
jgi:protein polybromo-1